MTKHVTEARTGLLQQSRGGLTLIELMVVLGILGILSSIMIPQILGFAAKAKQSEAKELLATVYTAETSFYGENNTYGTLSTVGFTPSATPKFYTNVSTNFTFTGGTSFTGSCSADVDSDATIDVWEVTQTAREPKNITNDIQG